MTARGRFEEKKKATFFKKKVGKGQPCPILETMFLLQIFLATAFPKRNVLGSLSVPISGIKFEVFPLPPKIAKKGQYLQKGFPPSF